jgi:hypothetical protein
VRRRHAILCARSQRTHAALGELGAVGGGHVGGLSGPVPQATNPNRTLGAFAVYWTNEWNGPYQDGPRRSFAHEVGHCLGLAHATDGTPGNIPEQPVVLYHDGKDHNCLMSYKPPTPSFCGLCLLRLRGYDRAQLNENGIKP